MQNKIDTIAIIAFISAFALSSCASYHPIEVRYERQQIPQELLECPTKPQCKADMQSEVARCLVEYDAALEQCRERIEQIKMLNNKNQFHSIACEKCGQEFDFKKDIVITYTSFERT